MHTYELMHTYSYMYLKRTFPSCSKQYKTYNGIIEFSTLLFVQESCLSYEYKQSCLNLKAFWR